MSWEQHRYACERAARMRRTLADRANEGQGGVSLQGEANSSDAEMLEEVAEFLKSLEGYDNKNGSIGFLQGKELAEAFGKDLLAAVLRLRHVAMIYSLPMPELALPPQWEPLVRRDLATRIGPYPYDVGGVRVRFGQFREVQAFV